MSSRRAREGHPLLPIKRGEVSEWYNLPGKESCFSNPICTWHRMEEACRFVSLWRKFVRKRNRRTCFPSGRREEYEAKMHWGVHELRKQPTFMCSRSSKMPSLTAPPLHLPGSLRRGFFLQHKGW